MIEVSFASSGCSIRGFFFPSDIQPVNPTVVFLQGFPGVEGDELICKPLASAGIHTLTFNYRGAFQSEGYFTFRNSLDDISAALDYVQESENLQRFNINPDRLILGGWSFGGALVPTGAKENPGADKIFMITGRNFFKEAQRIAGDPDYAQKVRRNLKGLQYPQGVLKIQDDVIQGLIELQDELDHTKIAPLIKDRDILLIGGWDDDIAPIEDNILPFYRELLNVGAEKVRIEAVQDDHEFSKTKKTIVQTILDWLNNWR